MKTLNTILITILLVNFLLVWGIVVARFLFEWQHG